MKKLTTCIGAITLSLLPAACGGTDEATNDVLVANQMNVTIESENAVVVNEGEPVTKVAPAEPIAVERKAAPAPPPKAPPPAKELESKQPATDPHAGHDINNMQ